MRRRCRGESEHLSVPYQKQHQRKGWQIYSEMMIQTPFANGTQQQFKQLRDVEDGNDNENDNAYSEKCDWDYVMAEIR